MEKTWEVFMKTGRVTDYLTYRSTVGGTEACGNHFSETGSWQSANRMMGCEAAMEWSDKKEI